MSAVWAQTGSARVWKQTSDAHIVIVDSGDPSACPWTGDS